MEETKKNIYDDVPESAFIKAFVQGLKKQLSKGDFFVEIMTSTDFAERLIAILEEKYDERS